MTTKTKHLIELTTRRPLATKPRRFGENQQRLIEEEIRNMEEAKIIEDSNSKYATDVVLVKKHIRGWRVCIDFRLVNQFTKNNKYLI